MSLGERHLAQIMVEWGHTTFSRQGDFRTYFLVSLTVKHRAMGREERKRRDFWTEKAVLYKGSDL